ncbi:PDZ domain-containing protein [Chitinophaga sp. CF118]|uniref:PDZ domain-containing protein n=1 Tax=Chitinophaga sp. CF118 TaxID=1884367 RepID=UPI0008E5BB72|nr:PDZ domain-containing protein [Chitinophaga sp. CF118]SFD29316.1 PDZ domain-containing protein [Chitinophaga sp. CF118]
MSKLLQTLTLASIICFAVSTASYAQDKKGDKLGEYDEIIIKRNNNKDGKVTIEIKDGNVLVDGEKMDAYKDGDISVYRRRIRPVDGNNFNFGQHHGLQFFNNDDDNEYDNGADMAIVPGKAILGVITEKLEAAGATIKEVGKDTPAEKAGLKAGDIITQIDADKIAEPKELFEKIGAHEPGDKITVTYLRNKKENKITVALDERKGVGAIELFPNNNSQDGPDNFFRNMPRGGMNFGNGPHGFNNNNRSFNDDNDVKLGLSVQDTENGEGAQVLAVAQGSAADKAGFKENDIITELAGTSVNSARDVTNTYRENKSKGTLSVQVKRDGKQKTLEVQVPRKLHKADL